MNADPRTVPFASEISFHARPDSHVGGCNTRSRALEVWRQPMGVSHHRPDLARSGFDYQVRTAGMNNDEGSAQDTVPIHVRPDSLPVFTFPGIGKSPVVSQDSPIGRKSLE